MTFTACLLVFGSIIAANVKKDETAEIAKNLFEKTLTESVTITDYFIAWHVLQTNVNITHTFSSYFFQYVNFLQFTCCGINTKFDWNKVESWNGKLLPPSCCQKPIEEATTCPVENGTNTGCYKMFIGYINEMITIFTIVGSIFILILVSNFNFNDD